jgi:hypothetical protein
VIKMLMVPVTWVESDFVPRMRRQGYLPSFREKSFSSPLWWSVILPLAVDPADNVSPSRADVAPRCALLLAVASCV